MARNYAALKHDYLLEMEELTDAEFGRLCRELLRYSIDGTESQMKGNERFFWNRVKMQEKRAKESYEELCQTRSESGKKGGRPKKQKEASESKEKRKNQMVSEKSKGNQTQANESKEKRKNQMVSEKSKGNQTQANESKKSQYEKEYEYENNSLPPIGGGLYAHAREGTPRQSEAVAYYCQHINPTPSGYSLQALERFEGILGAEVTIHAIQIAQDERKQSWNYIKAILERYEREGVRSLADIQASEQQRQAARQQRGWKKPAKAPVPEADRQPEDQAEFAARIAEQDAWMRDFLESQREEEG